MAEPPIPKIGVFTGKRKVPGLEELEAQERDLWESFDPFLANVVRAVGFTSLETVAQIHIDDGAPATASVSIKELEDAISNEVSGGDPATLEPLGYSAQPRFRVVEDGTKVFDFRFLPGQKVLLKKFVCEARDLVSTRAIVEASAARKKSSRKTGGSQDGAGGDGEGGGRGGGSGGGEPDGVDESKRPLFEQTVDRLVRRFAAKIAPDSAAVGWTLGREYLGVWEYGHLRITCKCRARLKIQTQGRGHQPNCGNFTRHLQSSCSESGIPQNLPPANPPQF